jgi:hypothetical protein
MIATLNAPTNFQVISEHARETLIIDPRSEEDIRLIEI